jgi:dimethylglycine dehydrogenase
VDAGGYGHTMEVALAIAYLPIELATPGTELAVEILGERRPAVVVDQPPLTKTEPGFRARSRSRGSTSDAS